MSVEDWARREAEREFGGGTGFYCGIVHAFSALLSDKAIDAVFPVIDGLDSEYRLDGFQMRERARAALQAAIAAVTEGDTE